MDVVITFKRFKEYYSHHLDSLLKRFHEFALAKYPKTIAVATKNICINGKTNQKAPQPSGCSLGILKHDFTSTDAGHISVAGQLICRLYKSCRNSKSDKWFLLHVYIIIHCPVFGVILLGSIPAEFNDIWCLCFHCLGDMMCKYQKMTKD